MALTVAQWEDDRWTNVKVRCVTCASGVRQLLVEQCNGGPKLYGGITGLAEMRVNLRMNCIPDMLLDGHIPDYDDFLVMRRKPMTQKMRGYFH